MDAERTLFRPYDYPPLPEELPAQHRDRLTLDEEKTKKLADLKSLLTHKKSVRYPDNDSFLLQFLRVRKFDTGRAATLCRNFFRKLHDCKLLFSDVDVPSLMQKVAENKCYEILPTRDRDGCVVIVILCGRWNPRKVTAEEMEQSFLFTVMQCIRSPLTQAAGFKLILDFSGYSLAHLSTVSPRSVWHAVDSIQNCVPCPLKGIYVTNENVIFSRLWSVLRLFMKQKLVDRFHVLGENLKRLHEVFPNSTLPEELGGTDGPLRVEPWFELMKDFEQYFTTIKQYGCNKQGELFRSDE